MPEDRQFAAVDGIPEGSLQWKDLPHVPLWLSARRTAKGIAAKE